MSCAHLGGKHPSNGPKFIYLWSCNMAWAGAWVFHFKWNGPNIRTGKLQTFAYVFLRFFFFLFQLCCKLPDSKHTLFEHWTWMKVSVVCPGNIMCKRRRRFTHRHNDRKLNNGKHPIRSEQIRFYVSANFLQPPPVRTRSITMPLSLCIAVALKWPVFGNLLIFYDDWEYWPSAFASAMDIDFL